MAVRDYTKIALGTNICGIAIQECPKCGKPALPEVKDGRTYYVHGDTVECGKGGEFETKFVMCTED